MAAIDQIVNVSVSLQTAAVPQAGFGTPLIIGPNGGFSEKVRYYSEIGAVLDDYDTSDVEYKYAAAAFGQDLVPTLVGIGKRAVVVAQVVTVTPNVSSQAIQHYIQTINGVVYDFTSDASPTPAEVVTGLSALINADSDAVVTATGSVTLILTADVAGDSFTHAESANLVAVATTANHGIADDIQSILDQPVNGNLWYGLSLASNTDADILQAASFIEAVKKIFVADSGNSDIKTSVTTDLASKLKARALKRTALLYSPASYNLGMSAAWLGGQLPQVPGASTWMFKTLRGQAVDTFTDSERVNIIGVPGTPAKNANIYEDIGAPMTREGTMAGGQYIDVTVGVDWFTSTLQTNIFSLLVNNPKIPYTDDGGAVIENAVRQTIKQGISNGLIDGNSAFTVTVPKVLDVPSNSRAARIFTPVKFSFRLAGAFHHIVIQGTVTA